MTKTLTKRDELQGLLARLRPQIEAVLPKHVTADRLLKVALVAASRTPKIYDCTPQSICQAVMTCAELGLDPSGTLGGAYLVPYKDQCTVIVGYRGLLDLARRSGHIKAIEARVVREGEHFEVVLGLEPRLMHRPSFDDGKPISHVYAVATLSDGTKQFEVMSKKAVDAIRKRSKASATGPWSTDYDEMARKTVVRRLAKYLPLSPEIADQLDHEAHVEAEHGGTVIEAEPVGSGYADRLREAMASQPAPEPEPKKPPKRRNSKKKKDEPKASKPAPEPELADDVGPPALTDEEAAEAAAQWNVDVAPRPSDDDAPPEETGLLFE